MKEYIYKAKKLEALSDKIKVKKEAKSKLSIFQKFKKALLS
jgi:hypothetical protein